ncbi:Hypothetical_protein [Hexamita inflata]|uniref:Hypothetical_protein n=1 Tax=Hexamita inflata TaxID=28002 RepID=A0AA86Q073_9EUKA|nr:Hypothetical protein HINF_LOCUS36936 [Hexamita inflata]
MVRLRWIPVQIGLHKTSSRYAYLYLSRWVQRYAQLTQVYLTDDLMIIRVDLQFQKSFQKCLYTSTIDERDKTLLTQLMKVMPGSRPSEIADEFQKIVPNANYFKRSLVMFITHAKK